MSSDLIRLFEKAIQEEKKKNAKEIIFFFKGKQHSEKAVAYNDAFFEIIGGKFNGNLVHRHDIVNYL